MGFFSNLLELWCIHEYDKELSEERKRELEEQDEKKKNDEEDDDDDS